MNRESTISLAQGKPPAQPLCASVQEMVELLDDAIHHDHDVFCVPGAQRNQDYRKHLAHNCFLFRARRLVGPDRNNPRGGKPWSGREQVLLTSLCAGRGSRYMARSCHFAGLC